MTVWKENRFGFMSIAGVCLLNTVMLGVVAGSKLGPPSVESSNNGAPATVVPQTDKAAEPVRPDNGPGNPLANLPSSDTPAPSPADTPAAPAATPGASASSDLDAPSVASPPKDETDTPPPASTPETPAEEPAKTPDAPKAPEPSAQPIVVPIPATSTPAEKTPAEAPPSGAGEPAQAQQAAPSSTTAPVDAPIVTH